MTAIKSSPNKKKDYLPALAKVTRQVIPLIAKPDGWVIKDPIPGWFAFFIL